MKNSRSFKLFLGEREKSSAVGFAHRGTEVLASILDAESIQRIASDTKKQRYWYVMWNIRNDLDNQGKLLKSTEFEKKLRGVLGYREPSDPSPFDPHGILAPKKEEGPLEDYGVIANAEYTRSDKKYVEYEIKCRKREDEIRERFPRRIKFYVADDENWLQDKDNWIAALHDGESVVLHKAVFDHLDEFQLSVIILEELLEIERVIDLPYEEIRTIEDFVHHYIQPLHKRAKEDLVYFLTEWSFDCTQEEVYSEISQLVSSVNQ